MSSDAPKIDKTAILAGIMPIIQSAAMALLVQQALAAMKKATVSNYHKSSFMGEKEIHPNKTETNLSEENTSGNKKEGSLSNDDVNAQKGAVDASETEAKASTSEAKALDAGASAAKTKAGATDVGVKGMKIM